MCGIAALFQFGARGVDPSVILRMTESVKHRGPDGSGQAWLSARGDLVAEHAPPDEPWTAALGHRRLSIIDLTECGRQPMRYRDRLWVTYNGEIYNYVELRRELERHGHQFRSTSDTEVILAAYAEWGAGCWERLRGMWGLVLVDGGRRKAILSRDRLGIKPLHWWRGRGLVAAVSEIKQLRALSEAELHANRGAVNAYLHSGYEDAGRTFFENVLPVPPGTCIELDLDDGRQDAPRPYWFPERTAVTVHRPEEAGRLFRDAFMQAVRIHLRSDVPVGCALSGGLDSTAVASCVHQLEPPGRWLQTFSVTFPGEEIDERRYVDIAVEHAGAQPHFVTPTADVFLDDLDRFLSIHDEPVGSLSQYAGYAVARLTREAGVPVTLNGQGGDEVLGGYWQSYLMYLRGLARGGRPLAAGTHLARSLLPGGNAELARQLPRMLRRYRARRRSKATDSSGEVRSILDRLMVMTEQERRIHEIRYQYLPRLLKWDDRNFMAFSVEGRYPFLDHEVIEAALSVAPHALYDAGWTKVPLRRGLGSIMPAAITERRTKVGFQTPQDRWLRGPLRPVIEEFLAGDSPAWELVSPADAGTLARRAWEAPPGHEEPGQALFRLFCVDRWLRELGGSVRSAREECHASSY